MSAGAIGLALLGFAGFWFLIVFLVAAVSGWRALAREYRSELPFTGRTWRFRTARIGVSRYKNALTIGVNPSGLYLAMFPMFRPGHPPLFIPWHDVAVTSESRFLGNVVVFTFRRAGARLELWEPLGREVLEAAGDNTTMPAP